MKDYVEAKWINKITRDAVKFCGTQQLRERLLGHIIGLIEVADREARQEQREKDAEIVEKYINGVSVKLINLATIAKEIRNGL